MPIPTCRQTHNNPNIRQDICRNFILAPKAHVALIGNQTKNNCCGGILRDNYYMFEFQSRTQKTDTGTFFVGSACAKDFLGIIGHAPLPLFSITHQPNNNGSGAINGGGGGTLRRPQLNQELYEAINLFIARYDAIPYGYLGKILDFVRTQSATTNSKSVIEFNRVLGAYNTNMNQIITDLNGMLNHGQTLRAFNFQTLRQLVAGITVNPPIINRM